MDSIGLLAAWVGVVSFLIATVCLVALGLISSPMQRWWAKTSPARTRRRLERLQDDLATSRTLDSGYVSDLVSLYGAMICTLVGGAAVVIVSIQILDLGPALLAAVLPFSINAKLLTRFTGLFLFVSSYLFVFRLCYLAVKIQKKALFRKAGFATSALQEMADLRQTASTAEKIKLANS